MSKTNLFILTGYVFYDNRGNEAIIRGTVEILAHYFKNPHFLTFCAFGEKKKLLEQIANECDRRIEHKGFFFLDKVRPRRWYEKLMERLLLSRKQDLINQELPRNISEANAVFSLGGDCYSLDYGRPKHYTNIDDVVIKYKKPLIIWGASIGPFSSQPDYERWILEHLRKTIIFARETETIEYLASKGLKENVYRVADPAFLLKAQEPSADNTRFRIEDGAIGLNLSPMLAKYVTNGNINQWTELSAKIIEGVSISLKRPIYLIPHVVRPGDNDFTFLKDCFDLIKNKKEQIILVPPIFNAAETKWIISKMAVFAGARMHATISSFSSLVPTLGFAYSIKTRGLHKDIRGNLDYCLEPDNMAPEVVAERIYCLLSRSEDEKSKLGFAMPRILELAMRAGYYLKEYLTR